MIDQKRLDRIRPSANPLAQKIIGGLFLGSNFMLSKTEIVVEGAERLRGLGGAVLTMNHTDRYNYWPLQYWLWRNGYGHVATWVKGKYYENPAVGMFMDLTNNIPIPSKGYVLSKDFDLRLGRKPTEPEYEALKEHVAGKLSASEARARAPGLSAFLERDDYPAELEARFSRMMERVVEINREALRSGLNILVFPQGTRSIRLTAGHAGAAQIILDTSATVVPIGCNGSDRLYPGNSPWSRGGRVVYRVGQPLTASGELSRFKIDEPFVPFTDSARKHSAKFAALTELVMERIEALLDPEYRFDPNAKLTRGADRFL
jgi:1-acyl-sn-glycerol-3-phosphate acyltransferase